MMSRRPWMFFRARLLCELEHKRPETPDKKEICNVAMKEEHQSFKLKNCHWSESSKSILVDLGDYGENSLTEKILTMRKGVEQRKLKVWIQEFLPPYLSNLRYMCRLGHKGKLLDKFEIKSNRSIKIIIKGKKFTPWSKNQLRSILVQEWPEKKKQIETLYQKCISNT